MLDQFELPVTKLCEISDRLGASGEIASVKLDDLVVGKLDRKAVSAIGSCSSAGVRIGRKERGTTKRCA